METETATVKGWRSFRFSFGRGIQDTRQPREVIEISEHIQEDLEPLEAILDITPDE